MGRLLFEDPRRIQAPLAFRADVACFVGFIARRNDTVPWEVASWLWSRGWQAAWMPGFSSAEEGDDIELDPAYGLPIPVESWEDFDALFAWDARPLDDGGTLGGTWMGAAVRSFFAQGGRRCYIVAVYEPWVYRSAGVPRTAANRALGMELLFPGRSSGGPSRNDRSTWKGVGALFGLDDVSLLLMPDLPDLFAQVIDPPAFPEPPAVQSTEVFVVCTGEEDTSDEQVVDRRNFVPPRVDGLRLGLWRDFVGEVAEFIARYQREVQLVLALPWLAPGTLVQGDLHATLVYRDDLRTATDNDDAYVGYPVGEAVFSPRSAGGIGGGIGSAHVQLCWPWLSTLGSSSLPGGLEPADGLMAGMIAANALLRGTFRSVAGSAPVGVAEAVPAVDKATRGSLQSYNPAVNSATQRTLEERVSLFGRTPSGLRVWTDVTTSNDEAYRPASVNRLVGAVVRAARLVGEDAVFEPNGRAARRLVARRVSDVMLGFYDEGAFRGDKPEQAFRVRCDEATTGSTDIDAGRMIVEVTFEAAAPIEQITVTLPLGDAGATEAS